MKRLALLLIVLGACSEPGGNPLGGGGGPPSGGDDDDDGPDAAVGIPDSGAPTPDAAAVDAIVGRMCRADSLLAPAACPAGANFTDIIAAHIESGDFDQADADGNFELNRVIGGASVATLRLAPTDANYRRSVIPIALRGDGTAGPMKLPVMLEEDWVTLTNTITSPDLPGDGAIVIYTIDGSATLSGVHVIGTDDGEIYYDNGAPLEWDQDVEGTGADGVILITSLVSLLGTRTLTLQEGTGRVETLVDIPIEADTITFVTVDFGD